MATLLLSAAGAAIGGSVGGTLAGLSSVAIGRFAGATLGRAIDQRLMGQGSDLVESGKVDRFRLTTSGEGKAIAQVFGRMRLGGQVIWATGFQESSVVTGGGKGLSTGPKTKSYSYTVSLAVALCEGEISRVGRVWADGVEVAAKNLNMRIYKGNKDQLPDPKIEAVEGGGTVPAYRGLAYVVMEDLPLGQFGNRVPQFSFEVVRPAPADEAGVEFDPVLGVRGVALIPGTGEYALAPSSVHFETAPGEGWVANVNTASGQSDFETSVEMLGDELPNVRSTSLVVSWFGDDLRCGDCLIRPKVEINAFDGVEMPWQVSGLGRAQAEEIARIDDRPVYGGTPADAAVMASIQHLKDAGQEVVFYPFILMTQLAGNSLPDPWSENADQPVLPWRGRITLSKAPGRNGSPDGAAQADQEISDFFGTAAASDFTVTDNAVIYSGPDEWRYRRFILHCAALCAAAGGVSAFCIGSEMRGLTQIRGAGGEFAAVMALVQLASEVRSILGPETKIGYAADWSEYSGYQPQDGSGDRYFHLDPLWADDEIDFIGIDNYMPLSDWRDGKDHLDAAWGTIYDLGYLKSNIAGGEGFDWYYHSPEAAAAQIRTSIEDSQYGEHWLWRYKDIRGWWENAHHERIGGVRQDIPTNWTPQCKPIWFTEIGCAAVDKGSNQPNKFVDPKSSESDLPKYSDGRRDDLMQPQYLRAMLEYWGDGQNNPLSPIYGAAMVDMARAHVWAWDVRPYPAFPANSGLWSDAVNFARGHWINGRLSSRSLASLVAEICRRAEVVHFDVSGLYGVVRGYVISDVADARAALQPLMLRYGFDAVERDGILRFVMRNAAEAIVLDRQRLAIVPELDGVLQASRGSEADMAGRIRLRFVQSDGNFEVLSEEAVLPDEATHAVASSELPLAMTRAEGHQTAERWLTEARVARDTLRFALPPSRLAIGAGDVVSVATGLGTQDGLYRVDRVEIGAEQIIDAVRIEPEAYSAADYQDEAAAMQSFVAPVPVFPLFMELPVISGDEVEHAPHLAVTGDPWPGSVAVYRSASDSDYALDQIVALRSVVGQTGNALFAAPTGLVDRGNVLAVTLRSGQLESVFHADMLNGANLAAIGDGSSGNWEIIQFEQANLVAENTYELRNLLRGQYGSDGVMPQAWAPGAWFVLLDGKPQQIELASAKLEIDLHFRIGPARLGYDDASYRHSVENFIGVGLKPYAPCHLQTADGAGGAVDLSWIRRSRVGGDSWSKRGVPLGEAREEYLVQVVQAGEIVREASVTTPEWSYSSAAQAIDGLNGLYQINVAQVSDRFGPGSFATVTI